MNKIEVLALRAVQKGNLKAFASVRLGALEINGLRVVQQPGQRAYVQLPVVEYVRDEGERYFTPLLRVYDKELRRSIDQAVLEAWRQSMN